MRREKKVGDKEGKRCHSVAWVIGAVLIASTGRAGGSEALLRFHAVAVNLSTVGRQGLQSLDIVIERWTTDAELATLRDAIVERGADALMSELQDVKPRVGYIRSSSGGLGWNIQYARKTDLPGGGYRVVFATDRPMSFWERTARPRSADYDFLVAEMRIGPNGKGEGKLAPMAKITYNHANRTIEIENFANEPVRLSEVTEETLRRK